MRIAVLGAGPVGLVMAAVLQSKGNQVALWNRSAEIVDVVSAKGIELQGAIESKTRLSVATTNAATAVKNAELIFVCVPASAHEDIARAIAPHIERQQAVVLVPGRTFGVLAFERALRNNGVTDSPIVAEAQTTPYSCRRREDNICYVFSRKQRIAVAAQSSGHHQNLSALLDRAGLDAFEFAKNCLITSMNSISPLMHCPTMLLNVSLVEANADWARKLRGPTRFYSEFITPRIAHFIERLDAERLSLASAMGLADHVESISKWGERTYGMAGSTFYEALQSNPSYGPIESPDHLNHRYLTEDVPTGLVPWESLGRSLGVPVPLTTLTIDLAETLLEVDFRTGGRTLQRLGFSSAGVLLEKLR